MASPWLQGIQVGSGIASDAMNRNLRMQELRSQEAHRRADERDAVARMALLLEKRDKEIDYSAKMVKAFTRADAASQETILAPGLDGSGTYEIPNPDRLEPEEAILKFAGPVVAEFEPDKTFQFARDMMGVAINRQQEKRLDKQITSARPLAPETIAATKELENQRRTSADVNIARKNLLEQELTDAKSGKGGTAPNIQKEIEWFEKVKGVTLSKEQLTKVLEIKLGLDQKAGTAKDRGNAVLEVFKSLLPDRTKVGKNAQTDEQLLDKARTIVDSIYDDGALGGVSKPATPTLKVGEVRKGYRYNGKFPPGDKRGWDKVQ